MHVADCLASPYPRPQTMPWEGDDHPLLGGVLADGSLDAGGTEDGGSGPGDGNASGEQGATGALAEGTAEAQEACETQICSSSQASRALGGLPGPCGAAHTSPRLQERRGGAALLTWAWTVS